MLIVDITKKLHSFTLRADFTLADGILGLMGSSGSGKSMTLKCIAGIERPDFGYIELDGKVLFDSTKKIDLPPQQRHIGYLFQSYALFPNMSALDNVVCGFAATGIGQSEARRMGGKLLAKFRLQGLADRYPRQLSGGQRQRVALARMLAAAPQVLLLDEPFAALDEELKDELRPQLLGLLEEYSRPAILVSHDKGEISYFCQRQARIKQGVLEFKE